MELSEWKSLELRVPNVYSDQITSIRSGVYAGLKKGRIGGFERIFFLSSALKPTLGHIRKKQKQKILSHIQSMQEIVEPPHKLM